ncbi:MAG: threonine-phosphate decarboxylase CobD [Paracoccaceae bacterium]
MTKDNASTVRDHGGNLDAAIETYGGAFDEWIDLSTGINPTPYPVPPISLDAWSALPRKSDMARLNIVAAKAYGTDATPIAFAGAQGAIQVIPFLTRPQTARILTPTYNEHAASLTANGWNVENVATLKDQVGADLAVVVNPNNPDGGRYDPQTLIELARQVGLLIIDESFADPEPELSAAPLIKDTTENVVVLRSFGKFYGLAGLRLGFALTGARLRARLADLAGPWPIAGPAIEIAQTALADTSWQSKTIARLALDAARLDKIAAACDWSLVGGTPLFRTYATANASAAQDRLARHHIWSRIFPYSQSWIRLGLPGSAKELERIDVALRD